MEKTRHAPTPACPPVLPRYLRSSASNIRSSSFLRNDLPHASGNSLLLLRESELFLLFGQGTRFFMPARRILQREADKNRPEGMCSGSRRLRKPSGRFVNERRQPAASAHPNSRKNRLFFFVWAGRVFFPAASGILLSFFSRRKPHFRLACAPPQQKGRPIGSPLRMHIRETKRADTRSAPTMRLPNKKGGHEGRPYQ